MVGSFGCPCARCMGGGTIAMQLRSKLCAIERFLNVDVVVTMGYRCENMAKAIGLPSTESKHWEGEDRDGTALAVDFFPRLTNVYTVDKVERDGRHWGNRRFDFLELTRPFFDKVWISTDPHSHNKWSIHGEIEEEDVVQVTGIDKKEEVR